MRRIRQRAGTAAVLLAIGALGLTACSSSGAATANSTATAGSAATANAGTSNYDTVTKGAITVGIYAGGLPYVEDVNGTCVGIDCSILNAIAQKLGLKVDVEVMSFPAMLAGVESHRIDVAMGELSWTAERAQAGLMTDPIYYSRAAVIQPVGSTISTIPQLQGKSVGVLVGANWIPAVQAIPGTSVKTYNSADEIYSDISIGRLQAGFIDALQDQYVKKIKPQFHYNSIPLQVTAQELQQHPVYATYLENQEVFFMNKGETALEKAMNAQIQQLWENKSIENFLMAFGVKNPVPYLTPTSAVLNRRGVDRPSSWTPPSLGYTPASSA
jgi:polar amino acid transport system substrate-binding protein